MPIDASELKIVFELLKENSTLGEVSLFLKSRGLHYSAGSWEQLFEDRLQKMLDEKRLTRDDLVSLLRLSEEHGKQHVFLYKIVQGSLSEIIDRKKIDESLKDTHLAVLLRQPKILDQPEKPTIVDIRCENSGKKQELVVKVVKRRIHREFVDETKEGGYVLRRYKEYHGRAVNLFRLPSDGILELRIFSHQNSSDYQQEVVEMWSLVRLLIPRGLLRSWPIVKAKTRLWKERSKLKTELKYTDSELRNNRGTILSAATGASNQNDQNGHTEATQMSLFDDKGASRSLDEFLRYHGYCDSSNIWWLKGKDGSGAPIPSKDTHMMLSGMSNEFAVTAKCSKEDYEHVLSRLKRYNY